MLIVQSPAMHESERNYTIGVILDDFLGMPWRHEAKDVDSLRILFDNQPGEIRLPNVFFQQSEAQWLTEASLPSQPLARWDTRELASDIPLVDPVVPVIYGNAKPVARVGDKCIDLPVDIFGSAFFMLSRYEEAVLPALDNHNRFPAMASLACQEGFLDRPIIDEYMEILWAAMQLLWPRLERKHRKRKIHVTCDLDYPYQVDYSCYMMARGLAADLLKRRSPLLALDNLKTRWRAWSGDFTGDPYLDNIDWMMDVNERAGNRVAFYFITGGSHAFDARYRMNEPVIRSLLRRIHARGHEIGLHASYNTYLDPEQTKREADILRRTLDEEGLGYVELGGRQHYLRWQTPQTARNWEKADMNYDSTIGYADRSGFRCGTSRAFPMYDLEQHRPMKLRQRPLILMDCSVIDKKYMAMEYTEEALAYMRMLKMRALLLGGSFTLLWHNAYFQEPEARRFYQDLIKPCIIPARNWTGE